MKNWTSETLSKVRTIKGVSQTVEIMPGSGVDEKFLNSTFPASQVTEGATNIRMLLDLGIRSLHLSGGEYANNDLGTEEGASFRPEGMGMGVGEGEWKVWRTNSAKVRAVRGVVEAEIRAIYKAS